MPYLSFSQNSFKRDSAERALKNSPSFAIFNPNYFITGVPLNAKPTSQNSDAKFEISFKQRITNAVLPFHTYLFLTYSQKSFWNIYQRSSPFAETNYHPTLGIAKILPTNNRGIGLAALTFEHESNGKDGVNSRSWDRIAAHYALSFSPTFSLYIHAWLPLNYKGDNPDLIQYIGYGQADATWEIIKSKLIMDFSVRKGASSGWKGYFQTQISYRLSKQSNQYLTLQWYSGHTESLINYRESVQMLRLGILIRAPQFTFY